MFRFNDGDSKSELLEVKFDLIPNLRERCQELNKT